MAIIRKYQAVVESVTETVPGIFTITFSATKPFVHNPGQFLHLTLEEYDPSEQWPESRCFSIQSNPGNKNLKITYSVKGGFTQRMSSEIYPGKTLWLKMPYGDIFNRGHSKENCVFIAGGTGITPFVSLITDSNFREYQNPKLFFGIKSKCYNIFSEELAEASFINDSFRIKIIHQDESGPIDIVSIFTECGTGSTYFISGPPLMIKSFKQFLLAKDIDDNKIRTDEWE